MLKSDGLTPIGHALTTYDYHAGVCRTWRVVAHGFVAGSVRAMVVLEQKEPIGTTAAMEGRAK